MQRLGPALVCLLVTTSSRASESADEVTPRRPLDLPMAREASGTSWQPDASAMHALHGQAGAWTWMTHGALFAGYDIQGSERGRSAFVSQNWLMGKAWASSARST
jgi:hypothetical protein